MKFTIIGSIEVLERTPTVVRGLLEGLNVEWTASSGKQESWAPFDIVGHLIHGEKTDWIPRAEIILTQGPERTFVPFDRFAQFADPNGSSLSELLDELSLLRSENLERLKGWNLTKEQLSLRGMHPELGEVTLEQLIATWVVHDLNHVAQLARVLAAKYKENVGPWKAYLSILETT